MEFSLLTIRDTGRIMSIGRTKVYELINRGELPVVRIGRSVRIRSADLEAFIEGLSGPERGPGGGQ